MFFWASEKKSEVKGRSSEVTPHVIMANWNNLLTHMLSIRFPNVKVNADPERIKFNLLC
jgi:hypothetical protein